MAASCVDLAKRLRTASTGNWQAMLPKPIDKGSLGGPVDLWSNFYKINISDKKQKVHKYAVDVYVSRKNDFNEEGSCSVSLTRTPIQGGVRLACKDRCARIVHHCLTIEQGLPDWKYMFYDHYRSLYIFTRIDDGNGSIVTYYDLPEQTEFFPFKYAMLELRYEGEFELSDGNFASIDNRTSESPASIDEYVEVSLTKRCLEENLTENGFRSGPKKFLCFSKNRVFLRTPIEDTDAKMPEAKEVLLGSHKNVEVVEGERGSHNPLLAIAVDGEKGCFLKTGPVLPIAQEICKHGDPNQAWTNDEVETLSRVLKGVLVAATYGGMYQSFRVDKIVPQTPRTATFTNAEGTTCTVEQYFATNRDTCLQYPNTPLAEVKRGSKKSHFPIECLAVLEGHNVPTAKQTPEIMKRFVKSAAMTPVYRQQAIVHLVNQQEIGADLKEAAGYQVETGAPIQVSARRIPHPFANYGPRQSTAIDDRGTWRKPRPANFARPGGMEGRWAFFVISNNPRLDFNLGAFADSFARECNGRGVRLLPVAKTAVIPIDTLEDIFIKLHDKGFSFALFAMDDSIKEQDQLKYLERKYLVATQNMKLSTAYEIMSGKKAATVENLIQKFNSKLGGLNYFLSRQANNQFLQQLDNGQVCVLGIGPVETPKDIDPELLGNAGIETKEKPVILSYAGNFGRDNSAFVGDFSVKKSDPQTAKTFGDQLLQSALSTWKETGRPLPERFVIYRVGAVNLDVKRILEEEIPRISELLSQEVGLNYKLTYIMAHKFHSARFFKKQINSQDKPASQNIGPGFVVDSCVTHPKQRQFYLNAHTALQGTAKTPKYTVLYDNANLSMDYLQTMTYDLCYMHQIVNLPTALPSPLRIAEEYASRGRRILVEYLKDGNRKQQVDGEQLEYRTTIFKHCRINA